MKKNFFKKLSFVVALAMIISVVAPAAGAFAASIKLNSTKKYLHLGVDGADDYNFNIVSEKGKGWKYTWESSDENVAVVNEKNGVVTATGVGTAKVTVFIVDKDGEEVGDATATVVVRDNIKEVSITKKPAGDKLAVGVPHDFNRDFVTVSGSKKVTSAITRWSVDPAEGATIDDKGVFTATKAGEYTITASSFQSKDKYNAYVKDSAANAAYLLASDTYKVNVVASMVGAKQEDKDTVKVTFNAPMADVDKNITVYQLVGETKVKVTLSKVEMDTDKKVASVSVYIPFTKGANYVVEYPGMDSVSFTAATTKVEDVASLQVVTTTAEINKAKDIEVKLFNSEGVDITTDELLARVTMKSSDDLGTYFNASAKQLTIFNKGVSATITATFHTYKYNASGVEEGLVEGAGVVTGVEADVENIVGLKAWTIVNDNDPKFGDVKQLIASDDYGYKLFVEFSTKTGSTAGTINSKDAAASFEFESADNSVLIISTDGSLYPVKQGAVTVIVKYGTGSSKSPIGTVNLTIADKKVATSFAVSTNNVTLTNAISDSAQVSLTVKDQLNRDFNYSTYKVEKLSGPDTGDTDVTPTGTLAKGDGKITFQGLGKTKGNYTYKITAEGLVQVVYVTILDGASDMVATSYRLQFSATSTDIAASAGKTDKGVTIDLYGYNKSNIKVAKATYGAQFKIEVAAPSISGGTWSYPADGTLATFDANNKYLLSEAVSGGALVKAPVGSYKVTAYEYKDTNNDTVADTWVAIDVQYFSVSDSQKKPVVASVKTQVFEGVVDPTAATSSALINVAKDSFKFTLDGSEVTNVISVDAIGTANKIYIKSVTIRQNIDNTYIDHKVEVGLNVEKKN